ncbi:PRC-barrel domain-containing protein [Brachybacterium sp. DNPG3]
MTGTTLPLPPHVIDLEGAAVVASDGTAVGRIRDIYLGDATGRLDAVTVVRGKLRRREHLVPAAAIVGETLFTAIRDESADDRSGEVRLRVTAAALRGGMTPPDTRHLTPAELVAAARALGLSGHDAIDGATDGATDAATDDADEAAEGGAAG